jgi:hypothetical protein
MLLPSLIFLVTGTVRVCSIAHSATNYHKYSKKFLSRVFLTALVALAYLLIIPTNLVQKKEQPISSWVNICDRDNLSFVYLVPCAAWTLSCYLTVHEYLRQMQEITWANPLFWALSLFVWLIKIAVLTYEIKTIRTNWFMIGAAVLYMCVMGALCTLAYVGENFQKYQPTYKESLMLFDTHDGESEEMGIYVKFSEKAKQDGEETYFQLRVEVVIPKSKT